MISISETLKKLSVQIKSNYKKENKEYGGSGVIFKNENLNNILVFTAKHCIVGKDFKSIKNIKLDEYEVSILYEINGIKVDLKNDILKIFETDNITDDFICFKVKQNSNLLNKVEFPNIEIIKNLDEKINNEDLNYTFRGYPNVLKGKSQRCISLFLENNGKYFDIQAKNVNITDNSSGEKSIDIVSGFSGSGVFSILKDKLYLAGIVSYIPDEKHSFETFKCFNFYSLQPFFDKHFESKISILSQKYFHCIPLIDKLKIASKSLSNWKSSFHNLENSHIERNETKKIIDWVYESNEYKPDKFQKVSVLVGGAGLGKSVVLKDVLLELQKKEIPVLGIKADRLTYDNQEDLLKEVSLGEKFYDDLKLISENEEITKIVIIIDQIDALSQSMSIDRSFIRTYNRLIEKVLYIDKVFVILSCREFDLNYDNEFSNYSKGHKINIDFLSEQNILSILEKLPVEKKKLNDSLMSLLKTPQNLEIFCMIYNDKIDLNSINTINDLYNELWKLKVHKAEDEKNLKNSYKLLYKIAEEINNKQKLSVSRKKVERNYRKELNYFISEGIIILDKESDNIQFFHQTFFDYVFALYFVNSEKSISLYLKDSHQGLFIRSQVKQVFTCLKYYDENDYIEELSKILLGKEYRFHIKLLLIKQFSFEENLFDSEKQLFENIILKDITLKELFFEFLYSCNWFKFLNEKNLFDERINYDLKNSTNFHKFSCYKIMQKSPSLILNYLNKLEDSKYKDDLTIYLLNLLKDYSSNISIQLFEKYKKDLYKDNHAFYHNLEYASIKHPKWVLSILSKKLDGYLTKTDIDTSFDYPDGNDVSMLVQKIYRNNPDECYFFLKETILRIVSFSSFKHKYSIFLEDDDSFLKFKSKIEKFESNVDIYFYRLLIGYLKKIYIKNIDFIKKELKYFADTNYSSLLSLTFTIFNLSPMDYIDEIFTIFSRKYFFEDSEKSKNKYFVFQLKKLINSSFIFFNEKQKAFLINKILSLSNKFSLEKNIRIKKRDAKNKSYFEKFKYELICSIPKDEIYKNKVLKLKYQELFRKFGKYENIEQETFVKFTPDIPPKTNNHLMSEKDWLNSFDKIKDDIHEDETYDFAISSHAENFKGSTKENPERFYEYLSNWIGIVNVKEIYIMYGVEGLIESKYDPINLKKLFDKLLETNLNKSSKSKMVEFISYFQINNLLDEKIKSFLMENIKTFDSPYGSIHPLTEGGNSIKGKSITQLIVCSKDLINFENKMFEILENISTENTFSIKHCVLHKLHYLIEINFDKTFNIFQRLTKNIHPDTISVSSQIINKFINKNKFNELKPFFEKSLDINNGNSKETLVQLLLINWLNNYAEENESFSLLINALDMNEKNKVTAINYISRYCINNENDFNKCNILYRKYLNQNTKELNRAYSLSFLFFKPENFLVFYDLINKFLSYPHLYKYIGFPFYSYLLKCCKNEPYKCIDLIEITLTKLDKNDNKYEHTKALEVVFNSYNQINKLIPSNESKKYLDKAMNMYDEMITYKTFRTNSINILEKLDK